MKTMKAFRSLLAMAWLLAAAALLSHTTARAAGPTHDILGLALTNNTGYVIDGDAGVLNPSYNREHLLAQTRVRTSNPDGAVLTTYYLRYRLLDAQGQPHPLYDSTGTIPPNATYSLTNTFGVGAGDTVSRTNVALLRPAARLQPGMAYTVELRLFTPGTLRETATASTAPAPFIHFTNLVSADAAFNVVGTVDDVAFSRASAVQTDPDRTAFLADVTYTLHRYDNFLGTSGPADAVPVRLSWQLIDDASGQPVALAESGTNFTRTLFRYTPPGPTDPVVPWSSTAARTVHIRTAPGVQLDPVDHRYRLVVAVSHQEIAGQPASEQTGSSDRSPATQLLHFNGTLRFGSLNTLFRSIDNDPLPIATVPGSHVTTTLSVDAQSGEIPGLVGVTYGNGSDLAVRLGSDGVAVATLGNVPVNLPPANGINVSGVRIDLLPGAALTPDGLLGDIRVYLPAGLGYREDTAGQVLRRSFVANAVPIGANLRPVSDVTLQPAAPIQVVSESRPLWLQTSRIIWRIASGRFDLSLAAGGPTHVRNDEYAQLEAAHAVLENPQRSLKRSNDRFHQFVQAATAPSFVQTDPAGVGRLNLALTVGPGDFRTHFPHDAWVQWSGNGSILITNDRIATASSTLAGAGLVAVTYGTGCSGVDCGPDALGRTIRLAPTNGVLQFTPDGGLAAAGALDVPHRLQWGYIGSLDTHAHEAREFVAGAFHMPGHTLRGGEDALPVIHRPAALLLAGIATTNLAYLERPDVAGSANQARYERGDADYAGINLVVGTDAQREGRSTIAGVPTGPYQLRGVSKYYARRGGVSGIHAAVNGSFPESLTLYGYPFNFSSFGLNSLDNRMIESRIDGRIDVPAPAHFNLEFAGLRLNCLGAVENAPMPDPQKDRPLEYWNGRFDAAAVQFRRHPEDLCNVTNAFLTVGASTRIAHVDATLHGTLGFRPDGNLIPRAEGVPDLDSRLKLPNVVRIAGPRDETYALTPVIDAYFNGHDQIQPAPGPGSVGWVNLAASLDVPFFEDLQIHLQTSANGGPAGSNAPVHLLGGWPTHGWESAPGVNFFTAGYFDEAHRGFANGTSPEQYRDSGSEAWRPRARRTWLGVLPFDYPLVWSSATRDFRAQAPTVNDLMVLRTEHELKHLSARSAEITFGAQFDGLPQFNLANLAYQAIDAATAAGNNAVAGLLSDAVGGFGRLDELLGADLRPYLGGVFDARLQPKIHDLYNRLADAYEIDPGNWLANAGTEVNAALQLDADSILSRLQSLPATPTAQPGLPQRLTNYLGQAEHAVAQIEAILHSDPEGNRQIASQLMQLLVQNVAAQFAGSFVDGLVQPLLAQADPTLDQIEEVLAGLRTALAQIRTTINDPVSGVGTELIALFNAHAPELNAAIPVIRDDIGGFLGEINLTLDSPVEDFSPAEIQERLRREIEDRFHGTALAAGIQVVHRHRLYDADAAIRQATDTVFQQLNDVMRDVIGQAAAQLDQSFTEFLGPLANVAAGAELNGYAHINGDSLKEARVDLHARLDFGSNLEFNGYLQIKELDSQGSAGCSYAGADSVTEVTLGAEDVQVGWISPELRASVGTKFTFDNGGPGGGFPLRGLGGSFELTGKLEYEAFAINYLGASVALGADENFLSGAAGMRVNKYDVFGGIYFGRACSIDPIRLWDPEAAALLGQGSFTGIYGYGEAWIPVNELIGIPASCLFNISAGLGFGAGVFLEGPTFVAKMSAGVSGEALCMVGIKGQLTGTAVLEGLDPNVLDGLSVKAKGTVGGKFGPCPFCLEFEQSVGLTFQRGKWKLDF